MLFSISWCFRFLPYHRFSSSIEIFRGVLYQSLNFDIVATLADIRAILFSALCAGLKWSSCFVGLSVNWTFCSSAQVMPALWHVSSVMSYVWLCLPCVSPFQCRVSLTLNQLAFGYWLMKTRLTVHMVPIEELPSTRVSIVLCLSGSLDSDVTGLDNSKLDFQMKYQWYSRLSWTKAIKFDFFFQRFIFFLYFFTAV